MKEVPEVLFVCVHNAGRSQMAAALLDHIAAGRVHVLSAGSTPAEEIQPQVVEAMAEIGLDVSKEFPKPLTDEVVRAADVVVTMGCGDACPIFPGKRYLDWDLIDPAGKSAAEVRAIRDEIERRVKELLQTLEPARTELLGLPPQPASATSPFCPLLARRPAGGSPLCLDPSAGRAPASLCLSTFAGVWAGTLSYPLPSLTALLGRP